MKEFLFESRIFLDLLLALVLGFLVGLERKIRSKEAGIRTHTIVCVGSALMTAISVNIGTGDPGRIAAQIVSGVGMACGASLYLVAIAATIVMIAVQLVLHSGLFRSRKTYSVKIEFLHTGEENLKIKEIFGTDRFNHLVIKRENDHVIYSATLNTETEYSSARLNEIVAENPFVLSIERCENE